MFYIYGAYGLDKDALLMQDKALELRKCFRINAPKEPEIRLLSLVAAGEMTDNTPLDFVVEKTNIQLEVMYVNEKQPDILEVPLHDIIFVGLGESTKNNPILDYLDFVLKKWPRPVINYPLNVKNVVVFSSTTPFAMLMVFILQKLKLFARQMYFLMTRYL
jgi:hypothetical protein